MSYLTKNRKVMVSVTAIIVAILLMAGTFAWQQMVSQVNEFIGHGNPPGDVIVHDDFNPNTGVKDVYIENPSSVDIFVRVKLNEAMNLTSNTWRPGASDWIAHTYESTPENCGHYNAAGDYFHSYFTWVMGGSKWYMPGDGSQQIVQDTTNYTGAPGAKQTPYAQLVKVSAYLAMSDAEKATFIGWIFDTDGYAYWSQPIGQDEVTGLLLHRVNTNSALTDTDYYYAIDVIVEAVDINDIPMWTQGAASVSNANIFYQQATPSGKSVINAIAALSASSSQIQGNPATPTDLTTETLTEAAT